jgi:phosphoribulokinase
VTGSSGAGTTSVRNTFEQIFRREDVRAVFIEGDGFHAFDRDTMRAMMAREPTLSHFAPRANLLPELEAVFRSYAENGTGRTRHYAHDQHDVPRRRFFYFHPAQLSSPLPPNPAASFASASPRHMTRS